MDNALVYFSKSYVGFGDDAVFDVSLSLSLSASLSLPLSLSLSLSHTHSRLMAPMKNWFWRGSTVCSTAAAGKN